MKNKKQQQRYNRAPAAAFFCYAESFFMVFVIVFFPSIHPYSTDGVPFPPNSTNMQNAGPDVLHCIHTKGSLCVCDSFMFRTTTTIEWFLFSFCLVSIRFGAVWLVERERYDSVVRLQLNVKQPQHCIRPHWEFSESFHAVHAYENINIFQFYSVGGATDASYIYMYIVCVCVFHCACTCNFCGNFQFKFAKLLNFARSIRYDFRVILCCNVYCVAINCRRLVVRLKF